MKDFCLKYSPVAQMCTFKFIPKPTKAHENSNIHTPMVSVDCSKSMTHTVLFFPKMFLLEILTFYNIRKQTYNGYGIYIKYHHKCQVSV